MNATISCPHCRKTLQIPNEAAGKKLRCPLCATIFGPQLDAEDRHPQTGVISPVQRPDVVSVNDPHAITSQRVEPQASHPARLILSLDTEDIPWVLPATEPTPSRERKDYRMPWYLYAPAVLPFGIPIATLGGAIPAMIGFGLGIACRLARMEKIPAALRVYTSLGISGVAYLIIIILYWIPFASQGIQDRNLDPSAEAPKPASPDVVVVEKAIERDQRPKEAIHPDPVPAIQPPREVIQAETKPAAPERLLGRDPQPVPKPPAPMEPELPVDKPPEVVRQVREHAGETLSWGIISPDRLFFAGNYSYEIVTLWDIETGRENTSLKGRVERFNTVAIAPDSKTVAVSYHDGEVWIWDIPSRKRRAIFKGPPLSWYGLAFSPDGSRLAAGGKSIHLWDTASGTELPAIGPAPPITKLAFAPDGKTLASGHEKDIKLWDVASGKELTTLKGHQKDVMELCFAPNGKVLASSAHDRTVRLWDVVAGKQKFVLSGTDAEYHYLACSPDGKVLATGSQNYSGMRPVKNGLKLWDVITGKELAARGDYKYGVRSLAFSLDGKTVIVVCTMGEIECWNVSTMLTKGTSE